MEPPVTNRVVRREMRDHHARLEAMEGVQRREHYFGDISEA
jgi:hypothetical protein